MSYLTMLVINTLLNGNLEPKNIPFQISYDETNENIEMSKVLDAYGIVRKMTGDKFIVSVRDISEKIEKNTDFRRDVMDRALMASPTTSWTGVDR